MKIVKKILLALLIIFVIAQFFGPEKNQGDITSIQSFLEETQPSDNVKMLLKESCYDCHSSFTKYPWYNNITPVNYWLAEHVKDGKKHLDFSKWSDYSVKRKDHKLEELIEMVEEKEMPLDSYTWTHKKARLSQEQIEEMVSWAKQVRIAYSFEPKPE